MLSRWLRNWCSEALRPLIRLLMRAHVSANHLTIAGLVLAFAAGIYIASGALAIAAVLLAASGVLDALDGELARASGSAGPLGGFVDSIADHYGDFAVYLGILGYAQHSGTETLDALVLVAMFGSLVGSHIRSRAGMLGLDTKDIGLFTRAERILVLVIGLASAMLVPAMAVLAVANNLSAFQRLGYVAFTSAQPRRSHGR